MPFEGKYHLASPKIFHVAHWLAEVEPHCRLQLWSNVGTLTGGPGACSIGLVFLSHLESKVSTFWCASRLGQTTRSAKIAWGRGKLTRDGLGIFFTWRHAPQATKALIHLPFAVFDWVLAGCSILRHAAMPPTN